MAPHTLVDNVCCWGIVQKLIFGREAKLRGKCKPSKGDLWDKNIINRHINKLERDLRNEENAIFGLST